MNKRLPWFEIALAVVFMSATLYAAFSDAYNLPNRWFIRDDAYYYYKVAQNLSEGQGSTFDGIHLTNGYHPLWLLLCIPIFSLARYDLILPLRLLAIVIGALQTGTAILLYRLIRRSISEPAAVLAACFWAFNTYVLVFLYKTGVESGITIFIVVALLHSLYRLELVWRTRQPTLRQIAGLAVLSALVVFGRLDLIFFSLVLGLWLVFRPTALRYFLPLDVLAIAVSTISAFLARLGFRAYYDVSDSVLIMLAAALICKLPILYFAGLYQSPASWKLGSAVKGMLLGVLGSSALLAAVLFAGTALGFFPVFSRAVLLLDAAITLALLTFIRLGAWIFRRDGTGAAFGSPRAALAALWRTWLKEGAVYFGILGGSLGAYMLWSRLAYGTFTPVSGQIKHWWGSFTHSIYGSAASSWLTFFAINPFSEFNAWAPPLTTISDWSNRLLYTEGTGFGNPRWQANFLVVILICAAAVLLVPLLHRRSAVRAVVQTGMIPLFAGSWLQILAYNATGYASAKEWYWLIEPILLILVGSLLLRVITDRLFRSWRIGHLALWAVIAVYGANSAFSYWRDAYYLSPYGEHPSSTPYSPIIPFLEANTETGALIGMTGGGNVGYLMPGRTIVNMDGLINSYEYFEALQAGTGADYLYDTGLRYIFANPTLLAANPYRGQYSDRLEVLVDWGGKDLLRLLPKAEP